MFAQDESQAFERGVLELDCPKMIVHQEGVDTPITYTGPGFIRQTSDRDLEFRQFVSVSGSPSRLDDLLSPHGSVGVGRLIPVHHYYSLSATDLYGRSWTSGRLSIDRNQGEGLVVTGKLRSVTNIADAPLPPSPGVQLTIRGVVPFPSNLDTRTTRHAGDEALSRSRRRDAARFEAQGCVFLLTTDDGWTTIRVDAQGAELPEHAETRIIEALQFVLGRSIWWSAMTKFAGGKVVTCLRADRSADKDPTIFPPINFEAQPRSDAVWMLFACYLSHVWGCSGPKSHTTSAWLNMARSARGGSVFSSGLALGVAIEGVLKSEHAAVVTVDPRLAVELTALRDHCAAWQGNADLKKRLSGSVNAMNGVRAEDRLRALCRAGIVSKEQIGAWKELRNRAAHARPPEGDDLQQWLDWCYAGTVLLYHLIFAAIGYAGPYTDYASPGWPEAAFAGQNVQTRLDVETSQPEPSRPTRR